MERFLTVNFMKSSRSQSTSFNLFYFKNKAYLTRYVCRNSYSLHFYLEMGAKLWRRRECARCTCIWNSCRIGGNGWNRRAWFHWKRRENYWKSRTSLHHFVKRTSWSQTEPTSFHKNAFQRDSTREQSYIKYWDFKQMIAKYLSASNILYWFIYFERVYLSWWKTLSTFYLVKKSGLRFVSRNCYT